MLALLKPYRFLIAMLIGLSLASNSVSLLLPNLVGEGINLFSAEQGLPPRLAETFLAAVIAIAVTSLLQVAVQVYASERVARDLRARISAKLSRQDYSYLSKSDPAKLLTNLTSDVDAIKVFVSLVIASLLSSAVVLIGASLMLLRLNARLGGAVLLILPAIGLTFYSVLQRVRPLFKESRATVDALNKVVEQNIAGAALVRVLHAHHQESVKFTSVNDTARRIGMTILKNFALMIPAVTFFANLGTLIILAFGGRLVLQSAMSLGDIAAFNSYLALLIFPIFVIGFMSNLIAQAQASYERIAEVLEAEEPQVVPEHTDPIEGTVEVDGVDLSYGDKLVLKNVSLRLKAGSRNAIVGPTAAGKSQLLLVMSGLLEPDSGAVRYDGKYSPQQLRRQVAVVFQESALFSGTIKDNIAFHPEVSPGGWEKAVAAAELSDFIEGLPEKEDSRVAERGSSLSGGQKQRITLARALALEPKVLLLDDFTARLDASTERSVRENLERSYPAMTLLAVTQRIATIADYDHIFLMMEGELLASGTHQQLLENSPEYAQIYDSQKSTHHYE